MTDAFINRIATALLPHDVHEGFLDFVRRMLKGAAVAEAGDIANITGPQARAFEAGVPSARVVRLPHASHYIFQANESDVTGEISAFIRALPQR